MKLEEAYMAVDIETGEHYALKIVKKKHKIHRWSEAFDEQNSLEKIKKEVAILKKCIHPNILRLYEVIDDPDSEKIYLSKPLLSREKVKKNFYIISNGKMIVLEYLEGGDIKWRDQLERPLLDEITSRRYFRDVVLGLEYCKSYREHRKKKWKVIDPKCIIFYVDEIVHFQGVVHRDIKPANLLLSRDGKVKISDFGVSYVCRGDITDEVELAKTAGTPMFFAPELCSGQTRKYLSYS
jgi:serine/threonine protein kinase